MCCIWDDSSAFFLPYVTYTTNSMLRCLLVLLCAKLHHGTQPRLKIKILPSLLAGKELFIPWKTFSPSHIVSCSSFTNCELIAFPEVGQTCFVFFYVVLHIFFLFQQEVLLSCIISYRHWRRWKESYFHLLLNVNCSEGCFQILIYIKLNCTAGITDYFN